MNSITATQIITGELTIFTYTDEVPLVSFVRKHLHTQCIGEHGRNEFIQMFDQEGNVLSDDDVFKNVSDEKCETEDIRVSFFVQRERQMKECENANVEKALQQFITKDFDDFRSAIIDAKAVIAGGSILSSFGGFRINDLDIYVNYSNGEDLLAKLAKLGFILSLGSDCQQASHYDSFFRKNNIMARFNIVRRNRRFSYDQNIDVMIIPDGHNIEDVVTNFDLSFCEIWWDGHATYASDPYGVRTKSGILKPDYRVSLFKQMNMCIVKRLAKYQARGFKIDTCLNEFLREYPDAGVLDEKINTRSIDEIHNINDWAMSHLSTELYNEIKLFLHAEIFGRRFSCHKIFFITASFGDKLTPEQMNTLISWVYSTKIIYMKTPYKKAFLDTFNIDTEIALQQTTHLSLIPIIHSLLQHEYTSVQLGALSKGYLSMYQGQNHM